MNGLMTISVHPSIPYLHACAQRSGRRLFFSPFHKITVTRKSEKKKRNACKSSHSLSLSLKVRGMVWETERQREEVSINKRAKPQVVRGTEIVKVCRTYMMRRGRRGGGLARPGRFYSPLIHWQWHAPGTAPRFLRLLSSLSLSSSRLASALVYAPNVISFSLSCTMMGSPLLVSSGT